MQTKQTVDRLSSKIVHHIGVGLNQQVRTDLKTAVGTVNYIAALVKDGELPANNLKAWFPTLQNHLSAYDSINTVAFGRPNGDATWVIRYPHEKAAQYDITVNPASQKITEFNINKDGSVGKKLKTYPFDSRMRPWYKAAVEAGHGTWSKVYAWVARNGQAATVSTARVKPAYDATGKFVGVVCIDVALGKISTFLRDGQIPSGGLAYLTGPKGFLIASSTNTPLVGANASRILARRSQSKLLASVAQSQANNEISNNKSELLFDGIAYVVRSIPVETPWNFKWTLTLAVPKAELTGSIAALQYQTWWIGAIVAVLMLLLGMFLSRSFIRPIGQLLKAFDSIGKGQLGVQISLSGWREFHILANQLNQMTRDLRDRLRLRHALNVAMEIQQQLLPANAPEAPGLDIAAQSTYCDETGGDYFDFLEIGPTKNDEIFIVLGDVMGHGISAALLMASARGFLRSGATTFHSLGELLGHVNNLLYEDTGGERFMTMLILVVNGKNFSIRGARAGQDPAIVYFANEDRFTEFEDKGGLPLGVMQGETYPDAAQSGLGAGDILLVSTDGLWETHNETGRQFGKDKVREVIRACREKSAQEIAAALTDRLNEYLGNIHAQDDVTFVIVKFKEDGSVEKAGA